MRLNKLIIFYYLIITFIFLFFNFKWVLADTIISVYIVEAINDQKILPFQSMENYEEKPKITLKACRGEFEPASFVVRANKKISELKPVCSNLQNKNSKISSEHIDIKIVKCWYQAGGAWNSHLIDHKKEAVLVPELLVNDQKLIKIDSSTKNNYIKLKDELSEEYLLISNREQVSRGILPQLHEFPIQDSKNLIPADIDKDTNLQYWITAYIPVDAAPGQYEGHIDIYAKEMILSRLNLSINVLPFRLVPSDLEYSIYYRGMLDDESPTVSSEIKNSPQLRAELINQHQHNIVNPVLYQKLHPKGPLKYKSSDELKRLIHKHLNIRQSLKMTGDDLYYLGRTTGRPTSDKGLIPLKADVQELKIISKQYNYDELYLYGIDEAKGEELLQQKDAWEAVRYQGAKIFAAGYSGHFESMGFLTDLLVHHGLPEKEEVSKFQSIGHKIFIYSNPQSGPENPLLFRKNYGFKLWQTGCDGAMPYAYQHSMGNIWNDFDHIKYRDLVFAYPTINGVINTIAWEGFREAIDDVRYLSTLLHYIKSNEKSRDPKIIKEITDAKRYVNQLKSLDEIDPKRTRENIIDMIMRLNLICSPSLKIIK